MLRRGVFEPRIPRMTRIHPEPSGYPWLSPKLKGGWYKTLNAPELILNKPSGATGRAPDILAGMRMTIWAVFGVVALSTAAGESPALRLVQTIPLPGVSGRFDHFAIDLKGQRLFVAALGNNTIEVLDVAGGKRERTVSSLRKPQGVAYLADRNQF